MELLKTFPILRPPNIPTNMPNSSNLDNDGRVLILIVSVVCLVLAVIAFIILIREIWRLEDKP